MKKRFSKLVIFVLFMVVLFGLFACESNDDSIDDESQNVGEELESGNKNEGENDSQDGNTEDSGNGEETSSENQGENTEDSGNGEEIGSGNQGENTEEGGNGEETDSENQQPPVENPIDKVDAFRLSSLEDKTKDSRNTTILGYL